MPELYHLMNLLACAKPDSPQAWLLELAIRDHLDWLKQRKG